MDDTTRRMSQPGDQPVAARPAVDDPDRRASEIRDEIEHTREEMAETIDAIQDKLRPSNIVANATERVKAATTERVRAMADTAGEAAYNAAERTRETAGGIVDSLRDNPYPALLVGAGLAWWISSARRQPSRSYGRRSESNRQGDRDPFGRYDEMYREPSMGERLGSRARGYMEDAREYADNARGYVSDTSQTLQRSGRRAQSRMQRMMHDNPLLVGAGALLLGAAFGMAVPETDAENEWMGEARDSVMDKAQKMASDAANTVQETASQVANTASNIADSVGNRQS